MPDVSTMHISNTHTLHSTTLANAIEFSFRRKTHPKEQRALSNDLVSLLLEGLLVLGLDIVNTTNHVEGRLGNRVVLTVKDFLESVQGLLEGDKSSLDTSENLGDGEWLRHESLARSARVLGLINGDY